MGTIPELIRDGRNGYLVEPAADALHAAVAAACTQHLRLANAMQTDIEAWHEPAPTERRPPSGGCGVAGVTTSSAPV